MFVTPLKEVLYSCSHLLCVVFVLVCAVILIMEMLVDENSDINDWIKWFLFLFSVVSVFCILGSIQ